MELAEGQHPLLPIADTGVEFSPQIENQITELGNEIGHVAASYFGTTKENIALISAMVRRQGMVGSKDQRAAQKKWCRQQKESLQQLVDDDTFIDAELNYSMVIAKLISLVILKVQVNKFLMKMAY